MGREVQNDSCFFRGQQQPVVSRDQQRDYFLAFQPSEAVPFRKPADVFAENSQLHNQNPGLPVPSETIWPGSAAKKSVGSAAESLRDDELFYGIRSNKRRRGPNQLPEQVKQFPEARAHTQVKGLSTVPYQSFRTYLTKFYERICCISIEPK